MVAETSKGLAFPAPAALARAGSPGKLESISCAPAVAASAAKTGGTMRPATRRRCLPVSPTTCRSSEGHASGFVSRFLAASVGDDAVATVRLGSIEGAVGKPQQVVGIVLLRASRGDADARRQP